MLVEVAAAERDVLELVQQNGLSDPAKAGEQLAGFGLLRDDGTTASGCWIYTGSWTQAGNQMARRDNSDPYGIGQTLNWAWAWPANRRILYNRASARPDGKPWSERKKLVWWDESSKKWTGNDVPDFVATKPPDYEPPAGAEGEDALAGDKPFILHPDGLGWIWVPAGLKDCPRTTSRWNPLSAILCIRSGNPIQSPTHEPASVTNTRPRPTAAFRSY